MSIFFLPLHSLGDEVCETLMYIKKNGTNVIENDGSTYYKNMEKVIKMKKILSIVLLSLIVMSTFAVITVLAVLPQKVTSIRSQRQ